MIAFLRALLTLALLALTPVTHAQEFPKLTGRVVDAANLLDSTQEMVLTAKLEALEKQTGRQLVVATIPDLNGFEISDYGTRLLRHWGIGDKQRNDGTLLVVAPNERKMWITTGYGVEGVITDALAARIYRNTIVPRFKANDYPGGIAAGVDEIATLLALPPDEARARADEAAKAAQEDKGEDVNGFMVIFWIVIILFIIGFMVRGSQGGKTYRRGHGPIVIWGPGLGGSSWSDGGSGWGGFGGGDGGGFSGGGGSSGGGGAGGGW